MSVKDEQGVRVSHVGGATYHGGSSAGPPTTINETATDRQLFVQGSIVRDTTYYKDGVE